MLLSAARRVGAPRLRSFAVLVGLATIAAPLVDAADALAADPVITVVDAGSGKKHALRWKVAVGKTSTVRLTTEAAMKMTLEGAPLSDMDLPAMIMTMRSEVVDVSPEGNLRYAQEVTGTDVAATDHPPQMISAMREQLAGLIGLKTTVSITPQGKVLSSSVELPPGADPTMRESFEQFDSNMSNMSAPFPDKAVGVGARWTVEQAIDSQGMKLNQVSTFVLKSIEGDLVTLESTIVQTAPAQDMDLPGMPPGTTARLVSLNGSGGGVTIIDLTDPMPNKADVKVDMVMQAAITVDGQTANMTTEMTSKATIGPQ